MKCTTCNKSFSTKSYLETHKKTVHEGRHEEDKNEKELRTKENEEPEGVENRENHNCKKCELSFASHKILQMHEVMVHQ